MRSVFAGALALTTWCLGCGDDTSDTAPPTEPKPTEQTVDCAPHELTLGDGACQAPGVPVDGCGEGFEHDGLGGCNVVLPAQACASSMMALPGEAGCRPVAACDPSSPWAGIPVDADTEYVDGSFSGDSDGTEQAPWQTVQQAIDAASNGAVVAIAPGSYAEDLLVANKGVRLWGRCPDDVQVTGAGEPSTIFMREGADGSEIHRIGITGNGVGLLLSGATSITVSETRIYDTGHRGINAEATLGPTSLTVSDSLVERAAHAGIYGSGIEVAITRTVVRDGVPLPGELFSGRGINIQDSAAANVGSTATLSDLVLTNNVGSGMYVRGSEASIERVYISGTQLDPIDGWAFALRLEESPETLLRTSATVSQTVVENNRFIGLHVQGSDVIAEAISIRETQVDDAGLFGRGVNMAYNLSDFSPGVLTLRSSLVTGSHQSGVYVGASEAHFEDVIIRDTRTDGSGRYGSALNYQGDVPTARPSTGSLTRVLIDGSNEAGVTVFGANVSIADASILATSAVDVGFGDGVAVTSADGLPATLAVDNPPRHGQRSRWRLPVRRGRELAPASTFLPGIRYQPRGLVWRVLRARKRRRQSLWLP